MFLLIKRKHRIAETPVLRHLNSPFIQLNQFVRNLRTGTSLTVPGKRVQPHHDSQTVFHDAVDQRAGFHRVPSRHDVKVPGNVPLVGQPHGHDRPMLPKGLPRSFCLASISPRHAHRACATNPIQVRVRYEFHRPRATSVSQPERQPAGPVPDGSSKPVPKPPPVHIDSKGRLSVKTADLATSDAFRTQLGRMVELAKTHPPKVGPSP